LHAINGHFARDAERIRLSPSRNRPKPGRVHVSYRTISHARAFHPLERAYDQAEAQYDYRTQRAIGAEMERFAQALKRDPQLDSILQQRGPEFGIAEGSRLTLVVQSEKLDRALTRELGLSHGHGLGMGM